MSIEVLTPLEVNPELQSMRRVHNLTSASWNCVVRICRANQGSREQLMLKTSSRGWEVRTSEKYCTHTHKHACTQKQQRGFIYSFFLHVQKSCKNHTLTLKCLIPHLNGLMFIWGQWTDHLWSHKTMGLKSGAKSTNAKETDWKSQGCRKNTDNVWQCKIYPLEVFQDSA